MRAPIVTAALFLSLVPALAIALSARADDGGTGSSGEQRILLEGDALAPGAWEADRSVTITAANATTFTLRGKAFGWAAMRSRIGVDDSALISVAPIAVEGGAAKLQIEWFDPSGQFIAATDLLSGSQFRKGISDKSLAELYPTNQRPASMRLKLWLEQDGAVAKLGDVQIVALRKWYEPDVRVEQVFDADSLIETDAGMTVEPAGSALVLTLQGSRPYSAFAFTERVPHNPRGVVMVDLSSVRGGVTLQALCWDKSGKMVRAIDLLKDMTAPGSFEVAVKLYADRIPPETTALSFKVWLGGGKSAEARLLGLFYGVSGGK